MKYTISIIFVLFFTSSICGQTYEDFAGCFNQALDNNLTTEAFNTMVSNNIILLTPQSNITQLLNSKVDVTTNYPIYEFKEQQLYLENISTLLNSANPYQRSFAYFTIAIIKDSSFENQLLKSLKVETNKTCQFFTGMALLCLKTNHTTELFDFLVENEDFGDAHLLPMFVELNKDSLQHTAYNRINSDNVTAKILAVQTLSYTGLNDSTDKLLRKAVVEWDFNIKGFAIYPMKELKMGNLLPILKPLIDSTNLRPLIFEALANSPTESDREYLSKITNEKDTVSEELLKSLFESNNIESCKKWLNILQTKPIPKDYSFVIFKNTQVIRSDSLLNDLHFALNNITNPNILANLIRGLENRQDEISVDISLKLLKHPDHSVRYWTAETFKYCNSPKLLNALPELLGNPVYRVTSLTSIAIENNIDNLQSIFENIIKEEADYSWLSVSIEYLSCFPLQRNKQLFIELLQKDGDDFFIQSNAAIGLAKLHDMNTIDLLIKVCHKYGEESDLNAREFIKALAIIKGDKAKKEIEKYKNSKEIIIKELVTEILSNW